MQARSRRSAVVVVALLPLVLLAAGCGEDVQQKAARELLQAHLRADPRYDGDVHCTDAARQAITVQQRTYDFVCAVRLVGGGCDWWRVELLSRTRGRFAFSRPDAGCTLPA
jgi:hypothetical protein